LETNQQYWFNTKTGAVEVGPQSLSIDRVGPFTTAAEAERAPEIIAERARRIREEQDREETWS
jgi:hypothetical protein